MAMAHPMAKRRHGKPIKSDLEGFMADARKLLNQLYILDDGAEVEGQSFSYFVKNLRRYDGWKFPGRRDDQHDLLEVLLGFKIANGRNDRGQKSEVVYLEETKFNRGALAATELRLESD